MSEDVYIDVLIEDNKIFKKHLRSSLPLEHFIYMKLLESYALSEETLISIIKSAGYDASNADIMRALMRMEIRGLLYVEASPSGNVIKLVREKRYLLADED